LKAGDHTKVNELCAALIGLPRPIPVHFLAAVTGNNVQEIRDACTDLNPAIRLDNDKATLADEDFEAFLRDQAEATLPQMRNQVATLLLERHILDEYGAINVASALHSANCYKELIQLLGKRSSCTPRSSGATIQIRVGCSYRAKGYGACSTDYAVRRRSARD
jgi:hypothetical protein